MMMLMLTIQNAPSDLIQIGMQVQKHNAADRACACERSIKDEMSSLHVLPIGGVQKMMNPLWAYFLVGVSREPSALCAAETRA